MLPKKEFFVQLYSGINFFNFISHLLIRKCSNNEYEISKSAGLFYLFGAIIAVFYLEKMNCYFQTLWVALWLFFHNSSQRIDFCLTKNSTELKLTRKVRKPQGFFHWKRSLLLVFISVGWWRRQLFNQNDKIFGAKIMRRTCEIWNTW